MSTLGADRHDCTDCSRTNRDWVAARMSLGRFIRLRVGALPIVNLASFGLIGALGLDTLVTAVGLGASSGLSPRTKLGYILAFPLAEAAMPLIGLILGHRAQSLMGPWLFWVSALLLVGLGGWMLFFDDDDKDLRPNASFWRIVALALSISIDELVAGFAWGLRAPSILWLSLTLGIQAILWTGIGLMFGAHLTRWVGEWAEKLGGGMIMALGVYVLASHFGGR